MSEEKGGREVENKEREGKRIMRDKREGKGKEGERWNYG